MDTQQNNAGWIVSAVLAVVIVILLAMMWQQWDKQQHQIGQVLENGQDNIAAARMEISDKCNGPKGADAQECKDAINKMSDIVAEFSKNIANSTTSAEANVPVAP